MPRIPIQSFADGTLLTLTTSSTAVVPLVAPQAQIECSVVAHGTQTALTVYQDETSAAVLSQPVVTSVDGGVPGWLDAAGLYSTGADLLLALPGGQETVVLVTPGVVGATESGVTINGQSGTTFTLTPSSIGADAAGSAATETTRAEQAEATNASAIASETTRAQAAEATKVTGSQLTAETTRAEAAESANATAIATEATRAEAAESANAGAISSETARAQGVEATKATSAQLASETTRAEAAESTTAAAVSTETSRAEGAEGANTTAIGAETTRAEAAEGTKATASQLGAETTRAEGAESTNAGAIATETARAEAAEGTNASAISSETTRAEAAEGANASGVTTNATAIAAETTRAEAAEATKAAASALATETTRAESAESVNATAVSSEVTRAEMAEAGLIPLSQKGAPNGVASLGVGGYLLSGQIPPVVVQDSWLAINVMDSKFAGGAKGNGTTNDTAAAQAAVNAAAAVYALTGAIVDVLFPAGYVFLIGQITIKSGVRISAYGAAFIPVLPFSGWLFYYPSNSTPQILSKFQLLGGTFLGTGTEQQSTNNGVCGNGANTGVQDVLIAHNYVQGWGACPFFPRNFTRVRLSENTILADERNNGNYFQNCVSCDLDGGAAALGGLIIDRNYIHNATADAIAVVVTSASANVPTVLNYMVTDNQITCDAPLLDAGCTFQGSSSSPGNLVVLDPNASTLDANGRPNLGKYVAGPGLPGTARYVYITAVNPGVSYTLSTAPQFTGAGTLQIGIYKNTIALEIDGGAGSSPVPFSNVLITKNMVTGTERELLNLAGSNRGMSAVVAKENVLSNQQTNANYSTTNPEGTCVQVGGNPGTMFDVELANTMSTASAVPAITKQPSSIYTGRWRNKFTSGPISGVATLGAAVTAQLTAANGVQAVTNTGIPLPVGAVFTLPNGTAGVPNGTTLTITGNVNSMSTTGTLSNATTAALAAQNVVIAAATPGQATVFTCEVQAGDIILPTRQAGSGAQGLLSVGTITPGVSYVIASDSATDTSTVYAEIVH